MSKTTQSLANIQRLLDEGAPFVELEGTDGLKVEVWDETWSEDGKYLVTEKHYCLFSDDCGMIDFNVYLETLFYENEELIGRSYL